MTPTVSVVMPVHNGARFLRAAMNSILTQTHTDFELVVVDDASNDESAAMVKSYGDGRIRLLQTERQLGVAAALNTGIRASTGDLIARQDADDISEAPRLERQVAAFRARPALALLGTQGTVIDDRDRPLGVIERALEPVSIRWYALFDNAFVHTSVMFRREAVSACGGYSDRPKPFPEDFALWSRMVRRFEVRNLADRLVRYRASAASVTGPLAFGTADSEYASAFADILRGLIADNLVAEFGEAAVADAPLLSRFIPGVPAQEVDAFCRAFERRLVEFERRHPVETRSRDFRRTLARQYDALAYRVTPPGRFQSLAVYSHALRRRPALAADLSWSRALLLVTLGQRVRRRAHALRAARGRTAA